MAGRRPSSRVLFTDALMYCQHCGALVDDHARVCSQCGAPPLRGPVPGSAPLESDPTMRMLLPVGRSIWAIAAGYAGLLAVTGCFAPLALLLGLIAIWDIRQHPEKHGMGRAIFGLVMGAIFTIFLILGLIGILIANSKKT
jgi:hypothetical protein